MACFRTTVQRTAIDRADILAVLGAPLAQRQPTASTISSRDDGGGGDDDDDDLLGWR